MIFRIHDLTPIEIARPSHLAAEFQYCPGLADKRSGDLVDR